MRILKSSPRGPPVLRSAHYAVLSEAGNEFLVLTPEGRRAFPQEEPVLGRITAKKPTKLTPQAGARVFKLVETSVLPPTAVRVFF